MNIFEQENYKEALKLYIRSKAKVPRGIFKNLANHLGVHATLVSQILAGTKDFTEEQIFSVCEFLGISKLESQYLWILVQIERAGSHKLRAHYLELKDQLRKQALQITNRVQKTHNLSEQEKAVFYSSWIYSAIHLFTSLNRDVRFEDVRQRFNLPAMKTRELLDFLVQIQLVIEHNGIFKPGPILTHLEKNSPFIFKHHTNWRLKAIQAAESITDQELMYSATISISKNDFTLLREEMAQVIQKFVNTVKDSPAEEIAQFNLDLFWLNK